MTASDAGGGFKQSAEETSKQYERTAKRPSTSTGRMPGLAARGHTSFSVAHALVGYPSSSVGSALGRSRAQLVDHNMNQNEAADRAGPCAIERARNHEYNPLELSTLSNPSQTRVGHKKPLYGMGENCCVHPVQPIFDSHPSPWGSRGEGVARARALGNARVGQTPSGVAA